MLAWAKGGEVALQCAGTDLRRVHHSAVYNESSSSFGFNLPYWDRLFGTYRAQPAAGAAVPRNQRQHRNSLRGRLLKLGISKAS